MNITHLLFVTNDSYSRYVGTMLCSVLENNKNMNFYVHILTTDMSVDNMNKFERMVCDKYHAKLDIRHVVPEKLNIDVSRCGHWGIYPSLKLYAADLFPEIDRILYLDADMVCIGSLKYIEQLDISDYYLAAATDNKGCWRHKQRLGIPLDCFYGCGGIMYINLKKWREDGIRKKCIDYFNAPENADKIQFGEQDVINKICMRHIMELPIEFNMFTMFYSHDLSTVPDKYVSDWVSHKHHAVIIHFAGSDKPWFKDSLFPLRKEFVKYAKMTPWGGKFGYSPKYPGLIAWQMLRFKYLLHRIGIRKRYYFPDC